jgi:hypothetical protein
MCSRRKTALRCTLKLAGGGPDDRVDQLWSNLAPQAARMVCLMVRPDQR